MTVFVCVCGCSLGEDGPTHQPIEMLEQLRALPNLLVFRPCDPSETLGSYVQAVLHTHTPSVLSLSRQAAPALANTSPQKVGRGEGVCVCGCVCVCVCVCVWCL